MSIFDAPEGLNKQTFTDYKSFNRKDRPAAREIRLKKLLDERKPPTPYYRKYYMDWKGDFHKKWVSPGPKASDKPLTKIRYDILKDTRSIWPTT